MQTLLSVSRRWGDAIATDREIDAWCRDHYGRGITVFVGINGKEPPRETDCPYVVIRPASSGIRQEEEIQRHEIVLGWVVSNRDERETTHGVREIAGLSESEDLGRMIFGLIVQDEDVKVQAGELVLGSDAPDVWPQILSTMALTLNFA